MSGASMDGACAVISMDAFWRMSRLSMKGTREEYDVAEAAGDRETCERLAREAGAPLDAPRVVDLETTAPRLADVDLTDLETAIYKSPDYIVESLLPRGHVTLLGGHGGSGKSMLALTLAAHVAAAREWAGLYTDGLPAVFVSLEDRGDLVRYRLKKIVDAYGLDPVRVAARLAILDGTDFPTLATEVATFGERHLVQTATMQELTEAVGGAGLIVIDNASDAFDGQENDRRQVRAFMRMLAVVARENDAAVCLLAHIDKSAARYGAAGNSYSGSTAWHNSARSRLALIDNDGAIELRQEKLNLGKPHDPIALEWTDWGVLRPVAMAQRARDDAHTVYTALRKAIQAGAVVNTATTSQYSAARCLEPYLPPELAGVKGGKRVHRALAALQDAGRIERVKYRTDGRKERERWELAQVEPGDE